VERDTLGWRQFLGAVNLRDFSGMVLSELGMIGLSVRVAAQSFSGLPLGPAIFVGMVLLALLRFLLLAIVVGVFGAAIVAITLVRNAARLVRS
jgi:hypothetical protein